MKIYMEDSRFYSIKELLPAALDRIISNTKGPEAKENLQKLKLEKFKNL